MRDILWLKKLRPVVDGHFANSNFQQKQVTLVRFVLINTFRRKTFNPANFHKHSNDATFAPLFWGLKNLNMFSWHLQSARPSTNAFGNP